MGLADTGKNNQAMKAGGRREEGDKEVGEDAEGGNKRREMAPAAQVWKDTLRDGMWPRVCPAATRHSIHVDTIESQLRLVALSQSCLACVRVCEGNERI